MANFNNDEANRKATIAKQEQLDKAYKQIEMLEQQLQRQGEEVEP